MTVFSLAEHALLHVVEQIKDEQWELEVPGPLRWRGWHRTLRDAVSHFAYDDSWVPDVLAGKTMAEVGDTYDGDLLGSEPKAAFARIADRAVRAVDEFTDPDRTVHLLYGDYPARVYVEHITIFRGFGAYDLARFTGADPTLPPDLVRGLWDIIAPQADALRDLGVFGPEVVGPAGASAQDRLLGLSGRDMRG